MLDTLIVIKKCSAAVPAVKAVIMVAEIAVSHLLYAIFLSLVYTHGHYTNPNVQSISLLENPILFDVASENLRLH